jgi:hypothetical protein
MGDFDSTVVLPPYVDISWDKVIGWENTNEL